MEPVIRPAVPADAEAIAALNAGGWRETYRGVMPAGWPDAAEEAAMQLRWHDRLAVPEPGALVLVAETGGGFAGFLATRPAPGEPGTDLFQNLYVVAALRGQGIGAALMRAGADRLAAVGRRRALLRVVAGNHRALDFYRGLGGVESAPVRPLPAPRHEVALIPFRWDRLADLATAARRRLARRLDPPLSASGADVAAVSGPGSGADHPVAAGENARLRRKQRLGEVFGLRDYGVNRVELDPGVWSAIPHWHSHEDEFVLVIEGELTLVCGADERLLRPGDCAGFPAGLDRPHHLENRSAARAVYLEVGSRRPDRDEVDYPGEDLRVAQLPDGRRVYVRRDGRPLGEA